MSHGETYLRSRGRAARAAGIATGILTAGALIVAMQLPLLHRSDIFVSTLAVLRRGGPTAPVAWPTNGPAALDIPALGVVMSHADAVVPIASLTKMMTAYVALKRLPLTAGASGPCVTVSSSDVALYDAMLALNESSAAVAVGEQLCERQLLEGLLVHSAGNYAVILANEVAGSSAAFVSLMNQTAAALGLRRTSYADVSGFSPRSVSTARDQVRLAVLLMKSPVVRSMVIQSSVTLPVAGTVDTFTPDVGVDNVIGVKSGRTVQAGGCDVMAMVFHDGSTTRVVYSAVLDQRSGNMLAPAGAAALALSSSAVARQRRVVLRVGERLARVSFGGAAVGVGVAARQVLWWWPSRTRPRVHVTYVRQTTAIYRGEVVGRLTVGGVKTVRVNLVALGTLSAPSLLQRLR